ncbi:MAG: hypothetical protein KatS3mg112_0590 [Thermogutta sp.]|nr:MAG: hypothetical protein KatS3mg112_0590 [Thermogutta sp.]
MNRPYHDGVGGTRSSGPSRHVRLTIPFPRARQACPSDFWKTLRAETSLGGTRSSGPSFDIGSSIAFRRGLKSRAESGAKAPHSIWSAAIHRRFLVKALAFTTLAVSRAFPDHETRPPVGAIHELPLPRWCWRDPLVGSVAPRSINDSLSPGTTSVPLRNILRRDLLVRSVSSGLDY